MTDFSQSGKYKNEKVSELLKGKIRHRKSPWWKGAAPKSQKAAAPK